MKILLVASEALPYFKSGGLADVARALPDALVRDGHDVRIFHPAYGFVAAKPLDVLLEGELDIPWPGGATVRCFLHAPETGAHAILLDHPLLRDATEPYISPIDPMLVGERFALFSRAALHYARVWGADLIHLNDWQTGLLPAYSLLDDIRIATVFSIHNLAYQGNYPPSILQRIGIPGALYRPENGIEFFGSASFMKAGIALADRVTTVSPSYAREIQTPAFGAGMDGLLRFRARDLHGILNGIDVEAWNPLTDPAISANYSSRQLASKDLNRQALLAELRLDGNGPLVVAVSRLAHQKGIDILLAAIPQLLERGASIAFLGDGDSAIEHALSRAASSFPERIAAFFRFDDAMSRRFYAGGDFFVMPSRYEPCGLGQMIAQRYGTVPIVRRTGGLADTIDDGQTGFSFDEASPTGLLSAVDRAFAVWNTKEWPKLRRRCMRLDRSWGSSAEHYEEVYRAAVGPSLS